MEDGGMWTTCTNALSHIQGIDIDDLGNGLPLFKPLEDAFDSLKLCITVEPT